ncbi:MAG: glycosyl transferase family 2 [Parcubacteria group bacterium Gr01-1014_44]|nr:MAG: glycosyl transferase family 2 [Parcubacteria group bacterium Gr01-1014_44]
MSNTLVDLSIVIPLFNEEESIPALLHELCGVCSLVGRSYEIVLINDGSVDSTPQLLEVAAGKDQRIKVLTLSRNFGQQAAFNAGIDVAAGKMVVMMDGDLQYPPSMIPEFIKHADEGYDIVIGERIKNKQNNFFRELVGRVFYKVLNKITDLEFRNSNDFGLYKRSVISVIKKMPEKERFLRGMVQWVGFKKKFLPYVVEDRKFGVPKYNFRKLAALVMSGVTSFSALPLRLALWAGFLVLIFSIGFSGFVAWDHYTNPNPIIAGWATLVILLLFTSSIQLIVLGVVGEYLYKMFHEVKGRPLYIVSSTQNIDKEQVEPSAYGIHHG